MEKYDENIGFITAKDFINDFATEDFIEKNIRVRPASGVKRGEADDAKVRAKIFGLNWAQMKKLIKKNMTT